MLLTHGQTDTQSHTNMSTDNKGRLMLAATRAKTYVFPLANCIRRHVLDGRVIIMVMVGHKSVPLNQSPLAWHHSTKHRSPSIWHTMMFAHWRPILLHLRLVGYQR